MTKIGEKLELLKGKLLSGNLLETEQDLQIIFKDLHNTILRKLLIEVGSSKTFKAKLEETYKEMGVGELRLREVRLQINTGDWIKYKSYNARQLEGGVLRGSRYISLSCWSCIKGSSLSYASQACAYSVINPSFLVGKDLLELQGTMANNSRLQELSIEMS